MGRIVIWIVGLACLSITYVAAIYFKADDIEYNLKDRANLVLTSQDISWATVAISGRDAILEGKAPDQASIEKTKAALMAVWGIRKVECHCDNVAKTSESLLLNIGSLAEQCQLKVEQLLLDHSIEFTTGSSKISDESLPLLQDLIHIIKECPNSLIRIAGHTDDIGDTDKNITLSLNRAEAVLDHFKNANIPHNRLKAVGYGDSSPRDNNRTEMGRKRNRRIEINITP